jgi:hypothetical protein
MDKKLTDSEIVKALECCFLNRNCKGCSVSGKPKCLKTACLGAIDLINRLQAENNELQLKIKNYNAENEKLKAESERLKNDLAISKKETKRYMTGYKTAKAEAYKEFVEKLDRTTWYRINQKGELVVGANSETDIPLYKAEDVYNLLKELVGDDNA